MVEPDFLRFDPERSRHLPNPLGVLWRYELDLANASVVESQLDDMFATIRLKAHPDIRMALGAATPTPARSATIAGRSCLRTVSWTCTTAGKK